MLRRRREAVIATKVSRANLSADEVRRACENSLRRLRTDYVDLYQIHWPSRTVPLLETMAALERLREQGKVRAIGVCNFGMQDLSDLLAVGWAEANQLPYSLLWRAIEYEIRIRCVEEGSGILCYSTLAQGLLTGKFASADDVPQGRARTRLFSGDRPEARHGEAGCEAEVFTAIDQIRHICDEVHQPMANVALAWLLHQPGVTSVIAGARRPDQISEFVQAFSGSHHYILDYLVEEVLDHQPEQVLTFLIRTSILDRLTGPLCDAVMETSEQAASPLPARPADESGQALAHGGQVAAHRGQVAAHRKQVPVIRGHVMLERLERANLILAPLDDQCQWLREIGYIDVDCFFKAFELAIFGGRKVGETRSRM